MDSEEDIRSWALAIGILVAIFGIAWLIGDYLRVSFDYGDACRALWTEAWQDLNRNHQDGEELRAAIERRLNLEGC